MRGWGLLSALSVAIASTASATPSGDAQAAAAYNSGRYADAQAIWLPHAKAGKSYAQYNMGILWQQLRVTSNREEARAAPGTVFISDINEGMAWHLKAALNGNTRSMAELGHLLIAQGQFEAGLKWVYYAARWGDDVARSYLGKLGITPPAEDLLAARNQQQQQQELAREQTGLALGLALACAVVGGCSNATAPTSGSRVPILPPAKQLPRCTLNPVFKDINGNPKIDCRN